MEQYIGCDAHKRYSVFVAVNEKGQKSPAIRVDHAGEAMNKFLKALPDGSPIAVETVGNWYWLLDRMEQAGHQPQLAHARKAKKMMGQIDKTDRLDAGDLAVLLRNGVLPSVWIPPAEVRDQRELPRTRMVFSRIRTRLKNRIHATFAKYNILFDEVSDLFGQQGRQWLETRLAELPEQTRQSINTQTALLEEVQRQLDTLEARQAEVVERTPEMGLLDSLPGISTTLATLIALEIGSVERFPAAAHLASYSGLVPRIHSSGGKTSFGRVRPDVNRYLKWAFIEGANTAVRCQKAWAERFVVKRYLHVKQRRGHAKAVVAVARHLAEASFWMLKKKERYREPGFVHSNGSATLA